MLCSFLYLQVVVPQLWQLEQRRHVVGHLRRVWIACSQEEHLLVLRFNLAYLQAPAGSTRRQLRDTRSGCHRRRRSSSRAHQLRHERAAIAGFSVAAIAGTRGGTVLQAPLQHESLGCRRYCRRGGYGQRCDFGALRGRLLVHGIHFHVGDSIVLIVLKNKGEV